MDFQRSGTYHILVVSGMNVSILAFVTFWLLRHLRAGDAAASCITMVLAVLYAVLTDVGAPVWRAVLMMAVYLGARLLYRDRSMLNAIGAAALVLILLDSQTLLGASFQLTFFCVLVIAAAGVPFLERTSGPFRTGLRHLDSLEYDPSLPAKVAQFRLDLRIILGRVQRLGGKISGWVALKTLDLGWQKPTPLEFAWSSISRATNSRLAALRFAFWLRIETGADRNPATMILWCYRSAMARPRH